MKDAPTRHGLQPSLRFVVFLDIYLSLSSNSKASGLVAIGMGSVGRDSRRTQYTSKSCRDDTAWVRLRGSFSQGSAGAVALPFVLIDLARHFTLPITSGSTGSRRDSGFRRVGCSPVLSMIVDKLSRDLKHGGW